MRRLREALAHLKYLLTGVAVVSGFVGVVAMFTLYPITLSVFPLAVAYAIGRAFWTEEKGHGLGGR